MRGSLSDEELHYFREALNQLPDVDLQPYMVNEGKFPTFSVKSVVQLSDFELFTSAVLMLQRKLSEL